MSNLYEGKPKTLFCFVSHRHRAHGKTKMVVRLRLARLGCRNRPFYRVMAADSRSPRDGKHIEVLGYYNPLPGSSFSLNLSYFLIILIDSNL